MRYPGHADGLRITVGTDAEIDRLLEALGPIVARKAQPTSSTFLLILHPRDRGRPVRSSF